MRTAGILASAQADAAQAEADLSALAADQANTMSAIQLIYAATICGMAQVSLNTARKILADVTANQPQEVTL